MRFYGERYPLDHNKERDNIFNIGDESYHVVLNKRKTTNLNNFNNDVSDLYIYTATDNLMYSYEGILKEQDSCWYIMRGEESDYNTLLLYFEKWYGFLCSSYVDRMLNDTCLLEIDLKTGKIVHKLVSNQNELILTIRDNEAYIYCLGEIYKRNLERWEIKNEIANLRLSNLSFEEVEKILFTIEREKIEISQQNYVYDGKLPKYPYSFDENKKIKRIVVPLLSITFNKSGKKMLEILVQS